MDGWRYLRLKPAEIDALTPREFTLLMAAERDHMHDLYEFNARVALMREQAHRTKRPKVSDLYRHPETVAIEKGKAEQAAHANEWLSQFNFG